MKNHTRLQIEYHYLYWACCRGNPFLVNHIIKKFKISPFMIAFDGRSPFLISIESNQTTIVKYLLTKRFNGVSEKDTKAILK